MRTFSKKAGSRGAWLLIVAIAQIVGGCKGGLELTLAGEPDLNGGGNAAVVRVYQLSNDTNFRATPIESFWRDDRGVLGSEYVGHQQVLLYPDQETTLPIEVDKQARFIGVAADLRQPNQDLWRQVYPVSELRGNRVVVMVGSDQLTVEVR